MKVRGRTRSGVQTESEVVKGTGGLSMRLSVLMVFWVLNV
jgi:hypothetical protein